MLAWLLFALRLLLCLLVPGANAVPLGRPVKRRNSWYVPVLSEAERVLIRAAEALHLRTPAFTFHMYDDGAKEKLVDMLWSSDWFTGIESRFSDANPALRFLLEQQIVDDDQETTRFRGLHGQSRWEAVIAALFRARSQRYVPVETAALSVMWLYYKVPQPIWRAACYFGRFIMSSTLAEELCDLAMQRDPGPTYPVVEGLTAAVFDNLNIQVGYSSFATDGVAGTDLR